MSSHRRRHRRRRSFESRSSGSRSTPRSPMRASTTDTETDDDVPSGHRRFKRPSASLPMRRSPASHHSCVLLNRGGARHDDFPGDRTTSAMSRTSRGQEISVSFVLVEPPATSFLTADLRPPASWTTSTIIAAHRDVVLLMITSYYQNTYTQHSVKDLFVYQASGMQPSLLLLPSADGPEYLNVTGTEPLGIMSCTSNDDDDSSPPFIVAYLESSVGPAPATMDARLFWSGSGQWEVFKNLPVQDAYANGDHDILSSRSWSTDAVVQYGRRYMIWVDYYSGMVIMDLSSQLETATTNPPPPPRLRYVPLPVDRVAYPGDPDIKDPESGGRGCPKESRSLCVTRHGIKFVSVDRQSWSNFGIGNRDALTWSHRFRITTWSLCEDDYTWRSDLRMHEEKFWDAIDGRARRLGFPHVEPQFPVVDEDNPDVVAIQLREPHANASKWMIEVDLRKKVLLGATDCSTNLSVGLSGDDVKDIKFITMKSGFDPHPQ